MDGFVRTNTIINLSRGSKTPKCFWKIVEASPSGKQENKNDSTTSRIQENPHLVEIGVIFTSLPEHEFIFLHSPLLNFSEKINVHFIFSQHSPLCTEVSDMNG